MISTPEYNASIPGGLKNAIDWASRPFPDNAFKGKPVLVIGASTGLFGAVWAQAELRKVLDHIGAQVLDSSFPSDRRTTPSATRSWSSTPPAPSSSASSPRWSSWPAR